MVVVGDSRRALEPRNFDEAFKLARITAASGMFGVKTAEEACVRIMTGVSLGLTAMQSLRGIHVVKGRPVLSADLMAAIALASGQCEYFRAEVTSAARATYVTKRVGQPEQRLTWTIEQANGIRVEGVLLTSKDVWKNYPDAMLRARCIAALARMVYPDLLLGVYTSEELAEAPPAPYVDEVAGELVSSVPQAPPSAPALATIGRVDPIGDAVGELRQVCKAGGVHEATFKRLARSLRLGQVEPAEAMRQAHEAAALVAYKAKVEGAANAGQLDDVMAEAIGDVRLSEWGRGEVRGWCGLDEREPGEEPGDEADPSPPPSPVAPRPASAPPPARPSPTPAAPAVAATSQARPEAPPGVAGHIQRNRLWMPARVTVTVKPKAKGEKPTTVEKTGHERIAGLLAHGALGEGEMRKAIDAFWGHVGRKGLGEFVAEKCAKTGANGPAILAELDAGRLTIGTAAIWAEEGISPPLAGKAPAAIAAAAPAPSPDPESPEAVAESYVADARAATSEGDLDEMAAALRDDPRVGGELRARAEAAIKARRVTLVPIVVGNGRGNES
jgi:hypothetical protein